MTGSVALAESFPGLAVYSSNKAALRSFAHTSLNELKGRNIRVDVLNPGRSTHWIPRTRQGDGGDVRIPDPAVKLGRAEEIAAVALFLLQRIGVT